MIDALTIILKREYELLVFKSYEETIEKDFSNINVALLDIKIAYQDGREIFSLLKAKYPQMKIIFHSAYPGNNENAKRAESLPHDGYLTKGNYDILELLNTIKKSILTIHGITPDWEGIENLGKKIIPKGKQKWLEIKHSIHTMV